MDSLATAIMHGAALPFPAIDLHGHVGRWAGFEAFPLAEHVAEMDRLGIALCMVSSLSAISGDFSHGNDEAAEATARYPGRFLAYAHVSARYASSMLPELERCFASPAFRGIKLYPPAGRYDQTAYDPVYAFAAEHSAHILCHTWGRDLNGLVEAAIAHPTVSFLAAHAGSDFAYATYLEAARQAPNLFLDLTYSREHAGMIEHFVAAIGSQRIVWGADSPLFSMAQQVGKLACAAISESDKRTIFHDNAAHLLRIE